MEPHRHVFLKWRPKVNERQTENLFFTIEEDFEVRNVVGLIDLRLC